MYIGLFAGYCLTTQVDHDSKDWSLWDFERSVAVINRGALGLWTECMTIKIYNLKFKKKWWKLLTMACIHNDFVDDDNAM